MSLSGMAWTLVLSGTGVFLLLQAMALAVSLRRQPAGSGIPLTARLLWTLVPLAMGSALCMALMRTGGVPW